MTLVPALLLGLVGLGACVYFGLWIARRSTEEVRGLVARTNEALAALARETGLRFVDNGTYQHPVVGAIPCYASVEGTYRLRAVRVSVLSSEDDAPRFEISVEGRVVASTDDPRRLKETLDGAA